MKRLFIILFSAALLPSSAFAQEAADKTREQLRSVMTQMRALQTEKAAMQAAQVELEAKNKKLEEAVKQKIKEVQDLTSEKQKVEESAQAKQGELSAAIARLESELVRYKASLDKWQAAHATVLDIAKKKEAERAKMSAKSSDLERQVADLRLRNTELFKVGNEILDRYKAMGLGQSLAAREPFTGNARVKLQNTVQGYSDKLLDQSAKP